ncbi:MAG TPA: dienelactone hydrolase family protein, partial [Thermomicrobiales bacterium]|nr:dienelactone hydrolase family protein [Thermomicrobiales bacterium]
YRAAVTEHHKAHDFIVYPDAGHGFMTFDPTAETYTAAHDSWNRTLEFLGIHLDRPHYRD